MTPSRCIGRWLRRKASTCTPSARQAVLVTAPPGLAEIVLQNLIENALRFTERGNVRVVLEPGVLSVEDTGVGLAGVDSNRIFERGYRSDASHGSGSWT